MNSLRDVAPDAFNSRKAEWKGYGKASRWFSLVEQHILPKFGGLLITELDQREIHRNLRILHDAEELGSVVKTCRYFGVGKSSFYRWRAAYQKHGEAGLINRPRIHHYGLLANDHRRQKLDLYRSSLGVPRPKRWLKSLAPGRLHL